jgi:FkbM family methyltransferase
MDWRRNRVVTVQAIFGPLRTYADDLFARQIERFGAHARPELAFVCSLIESGDCVFDIGAHIGSFAIPMAQRAGPAGRVVAIEAMPENFALLAENIRANGLERNVTALQTVIGKETGRYAPSIPDTNSGATYFTQTPDAGGTQALTLDHIAAKTAAPDLIKIDIEGGELDVLGNSAIVRERRPVIYSEVSAQHLERYGATVEDFEAFFRKLDYRLFRNSGERNAAHDDFIPVEVQNLASDKMLFDVLAVPGDSGRLGNLRL